jgi:hypothetical protein
MLMSGVVPGSALIEGWQQRGNPSAQSGGAAPRSGPNAENQQGFHVNGPGPHRGDWLRKYGTLPAPQQEQQLRQDPSFRSLPPEQQQKLVDRLHNFNSLSPNGKARVLERMETFEHLSPQQQQQARGLFQQYKRLPEDRQGKVSQAYHQLRELPPEQRAQALNSEEYRNNFSDQERDLLRGMTDLSGNGRNP